jgi:uncharacterized protein (DUF488 family)
VSCEGPRAVHTVGHSTRTIETFLGLLSGHRIEVLVDVRRWPSSRRFPQFGRETLVTSLASQGIDYLWRGDLGGYRTPSPESPNNAWRVGAFRAYADFMLTPEFDRIMEELQTLAGERRAAVMCAEALPLRCHRQLLADAFLVRGWSVRHILDDRCVAHRLPAFARPEGSRILYPKEPRSRGSEKAGLF